MIALYSLPFLLFAVIFALRQTINCKKSIAMRYLFFNGLAKAFMVLTVQCFLKTKFFLTPNFSQLLKIVLAITRYRGGSVILKFKAFNLKNTAHDVSEFGLDIPTRIGSISIVGFNCF